MRHSALVSHFKIRLIDKIWIMSLILRDLWLVHPIAYELRQPLPPLSRFRIAKRGSTGEFRRETLFN
jgi:hypothetical protein